MKAGPAAYGDANGILTYSLRNVVAREEAQVRGTLAGTEGFGLTSAATVTTNAGVNMPIVASGPSVLRNYSVTYVNGTLSVTKRPLRAVVDPVVVNQGEDFRDKLKMRFTVDENGKGGIVNNDTQRIGVQYVVSAPNTPPVGTYPLSVRLSNVSNYQVTVVPATLTVLGQVNYTSNYPARYPANGPWNNATYVDKTTYAQGTKITLPQIAQTGFQTRGLTFKGWELDGKIYSAGATVSMGTGRMTFKAVWTVNQYTLTVEHRVKGTTTAVAPAQKIPSAYGQSYQVYSVQHALYKAEKASETGVMTDGDMTIVMYYTKIETGGNNTDGGNTGGNNTDGGNTGGNNTDGGNTGGNNTDGGNTGGGNTGGGNTGGGNTGGGNTGGGNTGGGNTGGGNTGGGNTGGGNTGGGNTGGSTGGGSTGQQQSDGDSTPYYTIVDSDVPMGGVTARNVGHCYD